MMASLFWPFNETVAFRGKENLLAVGCAWEMLAGGLNQGVQATLTVRTLNGMRSSRRSPQDGGPRCPLLVWGV
jgi:hypothetical protein